MKDSKTLQEMQQSKTGFRSDIYGEQFGGNRDLKSVVEFELTELENTDIISFCVAKYGIYGNNPESFIRTLEAYFKKRLHTETLYAIWLTSEAGVMKHYLMDFDDKPVGYRIPKDALPISDLSSEGVLFVTKHAPSTWCTH